MTATAHDEATAALDEAIGYHDDAPARVSRPERQTRWASGWTQDARHGRAPTRSPRMASDKQAGFVNDLIAELDRLGRGDKAAAARAFCDRGAHNLTRDEASRVIERLITLRDEARAAAPRTTSPSVPDVPAGRYAVDNEDGALAFYRVDRPTEGRWAGYTFLSVQASDEQHPIKNRAAKAAVLAKIAADPREASMRYGREIGACGICGRTLTDEDSRAAGIGPVCASKTGW